MFVQALSAVFLGLAMLSVAGCDSRPDAATASAASQELDRIKSLQKQGAELAGAGRFTEAKAAWSEALALAEKRMGDGPFVELLLTSIGLAHANLGEFAASEAAYLRAIAIHDRQKHEDEAETATLFLNTGILYARTDRPAQAEPYLRRALAVARAHPPEDPDRMEFIVVTFAEVLRVNGKSAEADALLAATPPPPPVKVYPRPPSAPQ